MLNLTNLIFRSVNKVNRPIQIAALLLAVMMIGDVVNANGQSTKLSPKEIISKSLASICSPDVLDVAKRRMVIAGSEFSIRSGTSNSAGRAVLASDGDNMALFSTFNISDYRMERIGLFSNKVDIPFIVPGKRSPLGSWLMAYDRTLEDKIFGGSVFSSWQFWQPEDSWGKMETEGKKKIGDREVWVINYSPKKGLKAGSYIKLYFDAVNFHHLRTVYKQMESERGFYDTGSKGSNVGSTGHIDDAAMANNQSTLTEDFADYRDDKGLVLPWKYSINLKMENSGGTAEFNWQFKIEEYKLIKQFPANFFTFQKDVIP